MGQGSSATAGPPSPEELALRLTNIFAEKCFSSFELRCFKQTFKSLAEEQSDGVRYWPEATLVKFLELPDALGSGAALYQLCSYLGAFPFPSHAPAVLTGDALLRIVCLITGRYMKVMDSGKDTWRREIWRACAVFEPEASTAVTKKTDLTEETNGKPAPASEDHGIPAEPSTTGNKKQEESGDDEDELAFHAFELIDALEVYKQSEKANFQHGSIPSESFLKLLELLLLIAPLGPAEKVSLYTTQLNGRRLEGLRAASKCILASFGDEQNSGIGYDIFDAVVTSTLPHLFDSFDPLFEHFLFPKDSDVHKNTVSAPEDAASEDPKSAIISHVEPVQVPTPEPLLPVQGDILDLNLLSQLSFIFSDKSIFHRLRPLYLGHNHGYSMGSFEKSVFKWRAPSILLVSGTLISPTTKQSSARAFLDELPHRRLSSSVNSPFTDASKASLAQETQRIIYGAYIPVPWETTNKSTFGTEKTTLFQLSPVHDVFPASSVNQHYTYFNKPPSLYSGLGFGSPLPTYSSMTASQQSNSTRRSSVTNYSARDTAYGPGSFSESSFSGPSSPGLTRRSSLIGDEYVPLGPVSLHIDDALEFGVFTHVTSSGGSFQPSKLPATARAGNGEDWQDRFEIDAIEVWGVGDASVAEEQRRSWLWEAREAERRKTVNLGMGDIEADKELLKMAGLIKDEGRSGGSM
ncbi:restriction of telomere capping protein 5 [Stipitochalara longipes BDJ]|nr:restriction of telomere capping protein 5 [Stipitochalara longipes BDJ]